MAISNPKLWPEPAPAFIAADLPNFSGRDSYRFLHASKTEVLFDCLSVLGVAALTIMTSNESGIRSAARTLWDGALAHGRTLPATIAVLFVLLICLIATSWHLHLYTPRRIHGLFQEQRLTLQACFVSGLLLTGILYVIQGTVVSRQAIFTILGLTTCMLCLRRFVHRLVLQAQFERGVGNHNVLIVGNGRSARALGHRLHKQRRLGYTVKGFAAFPPSAQGFKSSGWPCETLDALFGHARKHFVDEIIFATPCEPGILRDAVERARALGIDLCVLPEIYDEFAGPGPVEYLDRFPTITLHRGRVPELGLVFKRILDIAVSLAVLTIVAPIMLVIALAIKLDSRGPVFYLSERVGKKGRVFRCIKFRTMVQNAEQRRSDVLHLNERDGVLFKVANDPRITRAGRFLRKYSLDELPQFFNVLRGEMSVVGPRPPIANEVRQYTLDHLRRLNVMPGITGLWQVQSRRDPSFDRYISLDFNYIENWSVWLDISIILRTVAVVFAGTGS